jgi:DNA-binding NtrC family response regulator
MTARPLSALPTPLAPPANSIATGWHGALRRFKRALVEQTLAQTGGNRTHAARALGLQRTYFLRLLRDLEVQAPPAARRPTAAPLQHAAQSQRR